MTTDLIDSPTVIPAGTRRAEVLALLRAADEPLSAAAAAVASGLHLNTARFHLDALVGEGLAERVAEARDVPGRPRILYTAQGPMPGPRSFGLLAEMLTGLVASLDDTGQSAVEAGKSWGRHLIERTAPSERVDATEATERLTTVLDAIGFKPETRSTSKGTEIRLHHCPFREVAEKHAHIVCGLHLGLMQGALGELRAPLEATSLEPFVTPQLCVAQLRKTKTS
ncbi:MAG: helix-turn-helix domain-containing protein [Mycobacteriales bacterium]